MALTITGGFLSLSLHPFTPPPLFFLTANKCNPLFSQMILNTDFLSPYTYRNVTIASWISNISELKHVYYTYMYFINMQNIITLVNTVNQRQNLIDAENVEPLYQLLQEYVPAEKFVHLFVCLFEKPWNSAIKNRAHSTQTHRWEDRNRHDCLSPNNSGN